MRKKKFTDKVYLKIKDENNKENPLNIDNYDYKTIKTWHQLKENVAKYFWVSFTCKTCGKKTVKHISNHFESRYTETTLVNCEQCNRKISLINSIGCDNPFKSKKIQNKIKKTNLKKYGTDNPAKSKEIQDKIRDTNIEKYGVENVFQNEQIKEKIKNINLKKYGVDNPNKSEEIKVSSEIIAAMQQIITPKLYADDGEIVRLEDMYNGD